MSRRVSARLTLGLTLVLVSALLFPATATADGNTPTRHDVQQARQKAAQKADQVAAVRSRLASAENRLQQAQIEAQSAAETYNQAQWKLAQAQEVAAAAQSRAQEAQQQLQQQREAIATLVAQSYEGSGQLAVLQAVFSSNGPEQLMSQYASYEGASSALQAGYERFTALKITADAFQQQAEQARAAQTSLTEQAHTALVAAHQAESAAATVTAQVSAEKGKLVAQLATLQGISTRLAAERQRALERRAARKAAAEAARKAARQAARERQQQEQQQQSGSGSSSGGGTSSPAPTGSNPPAPDSRAAQAIAFAKAQLGDPYVYGGAGPNVWDCSGLTMGAWGAAGVSLPHSAALQYAAGTPITAAQLSPGDLVFWATNSRDPSTIYHVAMYLGGGQMIVAPQTGEVVKIVPLFYWISPTFYARV